MKECQQQSCCDERAREWACRITLHVRWKLCQLHNFAAANLPHGLFEIQAQCVRKRTHKLKCLLWTSKMFKIKIFLITFFYKISLILGRVVWAKQSVRAWQLFVLRKKFLLSNFYEKVDAIKLCSFNLFLIRSWNICSETRIVTNWGKNRFKQFC